MTIEFEFVQDFRKYREYVSYITTVADARGLLPFKFYQGDLEDIYVIERKGNKLTVTLTDKTESLVDKFKEQAQPATFHDVPEGVAYLYDLADHELIYNFDLREPSSTWDWSHYPATFWMSKDQKYDHGLMLDQHGKVHRMYLANEHLVSLFVALHDLNTVVPDIWVEDQTKMIPEPVGVHTLLGVIADQLGQEVPRPADVKAVISNDMIDPLYTKSRDYDVKNLQVLFDMSDLDDDYDWEAQWGVALDTAIAKDDLRDEVIDAKVIEIPPSTYQNQLCISDLMDLAETPEVDRPTYVHLDIPIHGIHYMIINPGQRLCIWFDDLLLSTDDIKESLDNIPADHFEFYPDYDYVDDGSSDSEVH